MKIFHVGSHKFRESLRELLRELWVSYCSSRGMPFREWNFAFREWNFEFRELLREYPGTLRELREWPFHSESVSPEIGVVPRLLNNFLKFSGIFLENDYEYWFLLELRPRCVSSSSGRPISLPEALLKSSVSCELITPHDGPSLEESVFFNSSRGSQA